MKDPKHPELGDAVIDASDVPLVRMTAQQIKEATKVRAGFEKAVLFLAGLDPAILARADINKDVVDRAMTMLQTHTRTEELLEPTRRLADTIYETQINCGHLIACILGEIAAQVRRRAERDPLGHEILAAFEDLLTYQYGPAQKAKQTRAKKAKAKEEAEQPDQPTPPVAKPPAEEAAA